MKRLGLVGALFILICIAACQKTVVTPTIYEQFTADSLAIVNFLAENHINAIHYDSMWYAIDEEGTGPVPTRINCVRVKYTGYEVGNTTAFQTNTDAGLAGPLKGLIAGMQIPLKKWKAGTKGKIFMPSYLGYGVNGSADLSTGQWVVHPNTPIWFDLELVSINLYNEAGNYCYE